jgi:hypothetical protein
VTDDEARRLALRIIDTWPTAAKAYVWRDLLTPLDLVTARQAYWTLEREITKGAPTPGHLLAAYRAADRATHPPTTEHHDTDEPMISFAEYSRRLEDRADRGDTHAQAELERWRRLIAPTRDRLQVQQ